MRKVASARAVVCCMVALMAFCTCSLGAHASSMKSAARGMQREVGADNIGFQMLRRMGWQSGSIGQSQDGIVEPIDPLANPNAHTSPRRSGLGTSGDVVGGSNRRQRRVLALSRLEPHASCVCMHARANTAPLSRTRAGRRKRNACAGFCESQRCQASQKGAS